MALKFYHDLMSQPSRALKMFLAINKIPHESCAVALRQGAHKEESFLKINRFGRVPAIDDGGFVLSESVAIVRYVARKYNIDNSWYPQEMKAQASVDEFLEWHHLDLRLGCAMFFRAKILEPMLTGKPANEKSLSVYRNRMATSLDNVESLWLGDGRLFLTGDKITVADLFAACEIEQPRAGGYDPCEGRPKLSAWLQRVRASTQPHYDEAHKFLNAMTAKLSASKL